MPHLHVLSEPQPAHRAPGAIPIAAVAHDPAAEAYRLVLDQSAGLVRGEARGAWSTADTARYCADLTQLVARSRQLCGRVRVLLDRREVSSQSDEVCAMLADANRTIFADEDKIALIVGTSLVKASLRLRMPHAGTKAFLSMFAAETWLSV